ncbi:MAG: type II toxin-antitoxin system HipA family toxin [Chlamydiae bacterium]|nr:type II toxin-antitoxin system HipA family toxin [Chlamydiota bacterium]
MSDQNQLQVLLYDQPIGTLTHLSGDLNLFAWNQEYLDDPLRPILSLSFKDRLGELIPRVPITRTQIPPFFSNLLPEGVLRDYLAKKANIHSRHEFFLLSLLGQDLPGALRIQSLNDREPAALSSLNALEHKKKRDRVFRFSLAGIQLKFSAIKSHERGLVIPANGVGGQWIVKLPHSIFRGVPENEYTMMELARRIGIDVPEISLVPVESVEGLPKELDRLGELAFVIKRFDRTDDGKAVHIEDFAQVFGVYPEKKYTKASYRNIAEVIWQESGATGIQEFIRRLVFNALIGNGDMHLKNWSLIYREKTKATLAPAYDFVSTILYLPEDKLALNFMHSKDFESLTLDQFKRLCSKTNIPERLVLDTVQETTQAFSENWKRIKDLPLKKELQEAITTHLKRLPFYGS